MRDTPWIYASIAGAAIGLVAFLCVFGRAGATPPQVAPAGPAPEIAYHPDAGSGFIGGGAVQQSSAGAPTNQRPLPSMYAASNTRVAVPDGPHHVRYLAGNDPAAVKYMMDQRAQENSMDFENAPQNANTATLPGFGIANSRVKRINVQP